MSVLEVKSLEKSYKSEFLGKKIPALKGLSFEVAEGKVTGFLGANGAGKTTTLKCLLGLLYPDAGEVNFFGEKLSHNVKKRIGFLPERPYFYEYLKGQEFLKFYGQLSDCLSAKDLSIKADQLLKRVGLWDARKKALREYSKGMLQRIGIAQTLIHDPDFIILDEPMSGLDPDGRYEVSEIIKEVAATGKSIFFSSHLLNDVERICEDLIVLKDGKLSYQGAVNNLIQDAEKKISLFYTLENEKKEIILHNTDELQLKIDELRKQNAFILSVEAHKQSLESAYVQLNERG